MASTYDIKKSFEQNWREGFSLPDAPTRILPPKKTWRQLFGYAVASPLGIAACPLMSGNGIAQLSRFGFDIFTYKTIRSRAHTAHPAPNIAYVSCDRALHHNDIQTSFYNAEHLYDSYALANSVGNASFDPDETQTDIAYAKSQLHDGQLLIVSVHGTTHTTRTLAQDYCYTALLAQEAGAQVIECNVSCPNIPGAPPLYTESEQLYSILQPLIKQLRIPVIVKVGIHAHYQQLHALLRSIAYAGAQGICGINTVPITLLNKQNRPFFGDNRAQCGLSGGPIRALALDWTQQVRRIITQEQLPLTLLSTGGVQQSEHFDLFLQAGADAALSATGVMLDPYIAMAWHKRKHETQHHPTQGADNAQTT